MTSFTCYLYRIPKLVLTCSVAALSVISLAFSPSPNEPVRTSAVDSIPEKESFGMRMRQVPGNPRHIFAPVIITKSPGNEATILRSAPRKLQIFFINRPGAADKMMTIASTDDGLSWSAPGTEFHLPGQAYYANNVVKDDKGNLHCVFHIYGKGDNGYRDRHLDVWYSRTVNNGRDWSKPKKIYDGYVGSIRGFVQLKNSRLVLVFAKAIPSRVAKPEAGVIDYGWNDVSALYSDDQGESWQFSKNDLRIPVEATQTTRYGGVEPNIIELADGKVWMLIRTNKGHLYQSFSTDSGTSWQKPEPTSFISSDSPATTLRLSDGRIVLFWSANQRWDNLRSYANGGREILHAAISSDEGETWKGFREVLISPAKNHAPRGDRGTAYPSAVQSADGKIVLVSGQAEERAVVKFDPDWLEETSQQEDFSNGLSRWTLFGVEDQENFALIGNGDKSLRVRKTGDRQEAVLNFPMLAKGEMMIEGTMYAGSKGVSLALTDHFSVSNDTLAASKAVINFTVGREHLPKDEKKFRLRVIWDTAGNKYAVFINNKMIKEEAFVRETHFGVNYMRVGIPGNEPDLNGFIIKSVNVQRLK